MHTRPEAEGDFTIFRVPLATRCVMRTIYQHLDTGCSSANLPVGPMLNSAKVLYTLARTQTGSNIHNMIQAAKFPLAERPQGANWMGSHSSSCGAAADVVFCDVLATVVQFTLDSLM